MLSSNRSGAAVRLVAGVRRLLVTAHLGSSVRIPHMNEKSLEKQDGRVSIEHAIFARRKSRLPRQNLDSLLFVLDLAFLANLLRSAKDFLFAFRNQFLLLGLGKRGDVSSC